MCLLSTQIPEYSHPVRLTPSSSRDLLLGRTQFALALMSINLRYPHPELRGRFCPSTHERSSQPAICIFVFGLSCKVYPTEVALPGYIE